MDALRWATRARDRVAGNIIIRHSAGGRLGWWIYGPEKLAMWTRATERGSSEILITDRLDPAQLSGELRLGVNWVPTVHLPRAPTKLTKTHMPSGIRVLRRDQVRSLTAFSPSDECRMEMGGDETSTQLATPIQIWATWTMLVGAICGREWELACVDDELTESCRIGG